MADGNEVTLAAEEEATVVIQNTEKEKKAKLTISKSLEYEFTDEELEVVKTLKVFAKDYTFYVGVFTDEDLTTLYQNKIHPIRIQNTHSQTVTIEVPADGTYYLAEVDEHGVPIGEADVFKPSFYLDEEGKEISDTYEFNVTPDAVS